MKAIIFQLVSQVDWWQIEKRDRKKEVRVWEKMKWNIWKWWVKQTKKVQQEINR